MYLGQVLKEIMQMSRPTSPPAFPMEHQHRVSRQNPTTFTRHITLLGGVWLSVHAYNRRRVPQFRYVVVRFWAVRYRFWRWHFCGALVHTLGVSFACLQGDAFLSRRRWRASHFRSVYHARLEVSEPSGGHNHPPIILAYSVFHCQLRPWLVLPE